MNGVSTALPALRSRQRRSGRALSPAALCSGSPNRASVRGDALRGQARHARVAERALERAHPAREPAAPRHARRGASPPRAAAGGSRSVHPHRRPSQTGGGQSSLQHPAQPGPDERLLARVAPGRREVAEGVVEDAPAAGRPDPDERPPGGAPAREDAGPPPDAGLVDVELLRQREAGGHAARGRVGAHAHRARPRRASRDGRSARRAATPSRASRRTSRSPSGSRRARRRGARTGAAPGGRPAARRCCWRTRPRRRSAARRRSDPLPAPRGRRSPAPARGSRRAPRGSSRARSRVPR